MKEITGNEPINFIVEKSGDCQNDWKGLTIRQEFARSAMQGLASIYLSNQNIANDATDSPKGMARLAVEFADALIAELNKTSK